MENVVDTAHSLGSFWGRERKNHDLVLRKITTLRQDQSAMTILSMT